LTQPDLPDTLTSWRAFRPPVLPALAGGPGGGDRHGEWCALSSIWPA